jgi:hypothetical protein
VLQLSTHPVPLERFRVRQERESSVDRIEHDDHGDHAIRADDDLRSLVPANTPTSSV